MENEIIEGYRLSPQQKHLWLLQKAGRNAPYWASCAVLAEGDFDARALRAAAADVVSRHTVLRTTFLCLSGMSLPVQVIGEAAPPEVVERDLSGAGAGALGEAIDGLLAELCATPPDLSRLPLLRVGCVKVSPARHVVLLGVPALCADAAGLRALVRELGLSYAAAAGGGESSQEQESDEPLQYVVASEWLNELLGGEESLAGREYWSQRYDAESLAVRLPFESRPAAGDDFDFAPRHTGLRIDAQLAARVESAARERGATAEAFLAACWGVLLSRLAGREDCVVGVACDGRTDEELEGALGLLTKHVPLRLRAEGAPTFGEQLAQSERELGEARAWQECFSWEEAAGDSEEPQFAPFSFEFAEEPERYPAGGTTFSIIRQLAYPDRFKLKLHCFKRGAALSAELHYDSNIFLPADAERLAEELHTLIDSAAGGLETKIEELEIVGDAQRAEILSACNGPRSDSDAGKCIHELFEEQAGRTPDAVAVVYEGEQVSYGELNARANQLARHLRAQGVGPESVVGVLAERSAEMVVALLGVLKAGGAYLPLDPAYPAERLRFMVEDSGAEVVVATEGRLLGLVEGAGARSVCLELEGDEIAGRDSSNVVSAAVPDNLAYVIYTSGSTGRPKGVLINHRSPLNLLHALSLKVHGGRHPVGARVTLNAPISFDASVQHLLMLLKGATLYVIGQDLRADGEALLRYLDEHRIETLECTPSQLRLLLQAGLLEGGGRGPHKFVVGGEAIDEALWRELSDGEAARAKEFYNVYGPTECTVNASAQRIEAGGEPWARPVIGTPLANCRLYILDGRLRPVPVWAEGEIYIGGACVGRGYLRRPALTAERFMPDPHAPEPGARLYRTGDLGRLLPDGTVEYLSRRDEQVKIRGYRIEPGEVEATLGRCPAVREAVVVARREADGEHRLVAYVVAETAAASPAERAAVVVEVRDYLREWLPDYMIPSAFVQLERLPLTPNGKVDRKALPAPDTARPELAREYVEPRTETERQISAVWTEVLGLERVGAEDNFFEVGGHSLLATQVISRVRERMKVELPLRAFFETPTVAGLAAYVSQREGEPRDAEALRLEEILREIEELGDEEDRVLVADPVKQAGLEEGV